jgi:hypothetical protein
MGMDPIADLIRRLKASDDPEEIRRMRSVLRARMRPPEPELAIGPADPPEPAGPAADLAEVHRLEREQWAAIPGPVGARVRGGWNQTVWRD